MGDIPPSSHPPSPPPPPLSPPLPATVLFSEPASQLPARLPSVREMESSTNVLKELFTKRVVRIGQHYVAKYGGNVAPIEGRNMIFARQHLKSLVPRVYAIYQRPRRNPSPPVTYIIMEYIHARPISEVWSTMGGTEKLRVVDALRDSLQILRSIPPPDYFGGLGMTKLNDEVFSAHGEPIRIRNGPFKTESELIHAFILRYRAEGGARLRHKADYYHNILPQVLQGNGKPVFTHGDLQPKNIMIGSEGKVMITDWAASGWYPIWWEYVIIMEASDWEDDWYRYIPNWTSEFPNHYAWFHMVFCELWY
ncbi:kinase-like domain-containing protein [Xylaria sp. FL0043]|nr:kinase-like domain-containing protein [Xylaria sp. FL0043]